MSEVWWKRVNNIIDIPPTGSSGPKPSLPGIENFLQALHMCTRFNLKLVNVIGHILVFVHCLLGSWVVG